MFFARLASGHTSAGSWLGREEQDRDTDVTACTLGCDRLDSPMKGNHILCFEAVIAFFNMDFGKEVVLDYLKW